MIARSKLRTKMMGLGLLSLILLLAACAPTEFSHIEGESTVEVNGDSEADGGNSDVSVETDPPSVTDPTGPVVPAPAVYPAITIKIPSNCTSNMTCVVKAVMNRTDAKTVSFQWATNDTLYLTGPADLGRPSVHYVPAAGTVSYAVGTTQDSMPIQTLSQFTTIRIPFKWWDCRYGGTPINCSVFTFNVVRL